MPRIATRPGCPGCGAMSVSVTVVLRHQGPSTVASSGEVWLTQGPRSGRIRDLPEGGSGDRYRWARGGLDDDTLGSCRGHPGAYAVEDLVCGPAGLADQQGPLVLVGEQVTRAVDQLTKIRPRHPGDLLGGVCGEGDSPVAAGPGMPQH